MTTAPVSPAEPSAGGRIVRNAVALGLSRPFTWFSAIGLAVLLPRYLGDVNLGKINFAFAFADWCGLLVSLGISTYLTKEVARREPEAGRLILNALVLRSAVALGVGGVAAAVATLLDFDGLTRQLVYLLTGHMLLVVVSGVLVGGLQGMQRLRIVAVVDAASKMLLLGLVALFLSRGDGPIGVAVAYVLSDVLLIGAYLYALRRLGGLRGTIDLSIWRALVLGGMPFLLWEAALLTYARVDVLLLAIFTHDAVLGWYHAAYRLISIPLFIPAVVMTAIFPALSATAKDVALFSAIARRGVRVGLLVTLPMALGLMVLADKVVEFLGYPPEFRNSVTPIVLLAPSLPLVAVNMIVGSVLVARDRQRSWALVGVGAAVINPALNLLAIPYTQAQFGNGAIGAAAVTSFTEVFLLVAGQYLLPKGIIDTGTALNALKCLLVGLTMAAVVWNVRELPVIFGVLVGAVVYVAGCFLVGAVSLDDLRRLRRA
jgi:O-antigen/teichoic acid export membrane protein